MALPSRLRQALPLAYRLRCQAVCSSGLQTTRGFADKIDEKGRGDEIVHFRKEDERVLRELLKKMKLQADANDASNAEKVAGAERQALDQIVGKYNISEEDIKSLVAWKHAS